MSRLIFLSVFLMYSFSVKIDCSIALADKLYYEKNYKKAYELYKKIEPKGVDLNYKLGISAYKIDKLGYAMLYLKRAESKCVFSNRIEILDKIYEIKQKVNGLQHYELSFLNPLNKFKDYILSLLRSTNIFMVKLLFLFFWIFSFFYIRYLFKKKRIFHIYVLFFLVFISGVLFIGRHRLDYRYYGVVVGKCGHVLAGPGFKYSVKKLLPEGSFVRIYQKTNQFYKIKAGKIIGWVDNRLIKPVISKSF